MRVAGKIALITGAGPNIGREIALKLASEGALVLCNDINEAHAVAAANYIKEQGFKAEAYPADITNYNQMQALVKEAESKHGVINVLVNNAAITIPKGLLTISLEEWERNTRIIIDGTFNTSRVVAQSLVDNKKPGSIINIVSTSGHRGRANAIAYTTAKGGVLNFTRSMAVELAPHGIRVNSVSPTKTGVSVAGNKERNYSEIPLGRLGTPIEQANAVLFLASDEASFITGEDIRVDGGSLSTWGA